MAASTSGDDAHQHQDADQHWDRELHAADQKRNDSAADRQRQGTEWSSADRPICRR
jgi:hypothetical protein